MKRLFLILLATIIVSNTFAYDFNTFRKDVSKNFKEITEWFGDLYSQYFPKNSEDVVKILDNTYNTGESLANKYLKPVVVDYSPTLIKSLDNLCDYDPKHDYEEFEYETIGGMGHSFLIQKDANTGKLIAICHDDWGCPCTSHNDGILYEYMHEYVETMRECGLIDSRFSWDNKPNLANDNDCEVLR